MLLEIDAVARGLTASSDDMSVQHNHQLMIWLFMHVSDRCVDIDMAQRQGMTVQQK